MKNKKILSLILVVLFMVIAALSCNRKTSEKATVVSENIIQKPADDSIKTISDSVSVIKSNSKENEKSVAKKYANGADLKVISATSQKWTGGIKGSGSGINYRFKVIVSLSSQELTIDQLWIDSVFHKPQVLKNNLTTENFIFQAGDTIFILASDYFKSPDSPKFAEGEQPTNLENNPVKKINPPYKFSGKALIGYTIKGIRKFKTVEKIILLPPQNRP